MILEMKDVAAWFEERHGHQIVGVKYDANDSGALLELKVRYGSKLETVELTGLDSRGLLSMPSYGSRIVSAQVFEGSVLLDLAVPGRAYQLVLSAA